MLKKENMLIITFKTTAEAMAMERVCKEKNASGRLIPVPKSISAGCGMAWCTKPETEPFFREFMAKNEIHPESIQTCLI